MQTNVMMFSPKEKSNPTDMTPHTTEKSKQLSSKPPVLTIFHRLITKLRSLQQRERKKLFASFLLAKS